MPSSLPVLRKTHECDCFRCTEIGEEAAFAGALLPPISEVTDRHQILGNGKTR